MPMPEQLYLCLSRFHRRSSQLPAQITAYPTFGLSQTEETLRIIKFDVSTDPVGDLKNYTGFRKYLAQSNESTSRTVTPRWEIGIRLIKSCYAFDTKKISQNVDVAIVQIANLNISEKRYVRSMPLFGSGMGGEILMPRSQWSTQQV